MQPTVSQLQDIYGDDVAFQIIDANSTDGALWFAQLTLPGHPSYVLFDADGGETFRTFGVVDQAVLEAPLQSVLLSSP
jgi:hypothetical protein